MVIADKTIDFVWASQIQVRRVAHESRKRTLLARARAGLFRRTVGETGFDDAYISVERWGQQSIAVLPHVSE
ncbi:MAG: hypothetical protein OHK0046_42200 [Anaerolineae bacterium]